MHNQLPDLAKQDEALPSGSGHWQIPLAEDQDKAPVEILNVNNIFVLHKTSSRATKDVHCIWSVFPRAVVAMHVAYYECGMNE